MDNRITIRDIAAKSGVSTTTVSRYLNGKYEFMSDDTRQRIKAVIQKTGYRPNKLAGSLKTARTNTIGLVLSNPASNLYPFLIGSICNSSTLLGQKTIVITTDEDEEKERVQVEELIDSQVDGLLVFTGTNLSFYENLRQKYGLPIVLADRVPISTQLDWVAINHYAGTANVIKYLISKGYEKIVLVVRENRSHRGTIALREQSAEETCRLHFGDDSHFKRILIREDNAGSLIHGNNEHILDCLELCYAQSRDCPTAVFVADGILMGRFICGIYRLGLKLSSNFHLAGYDIWNFSTLLPQPICTIEQPLFDLGTLATEMLVARISERFSDQQDQDGPRLPLHKLLDCSISYPG